ncbi:MAG TPA: L,D-transpeptidase family protein [Sphingomicrobium sp.]|jgi:L,D-transpeptidase YcbB|nr:L,D-transpeptidase family protein [Sphingomicrobium sp.]
MSNGYPSTMRIKAQSLVVFTTLAAVPLGFAFAQEMGAPGPAMPSPTVAPAPVQPAPEPVVVPPPTWTAADAQELLAFIRGIGAEGLDPLDYTPDRLAAAIGSGNSDLMSQAATERFKRVSNDLALGYVRRADRQQWLIPDPDLDSSRQDLLLRTALQQNRIGDALRGLLPTHPQYASLKTALAATPKSETAKINRIRLNMDRWRWLPRDLGERYIIVNVPAYTAALVEDGITKSRHRAVAGATRTPTPQLMATATGVILNPWWEVPKSIEPEVRGKRGYVAVKNDKGETIRWRQPPGPSNALGQIKFVMPNPEAIYLHDTNARGLFDTRARAYSHGCIRTEHIMQLAKILLAEDGGEWTAEKVDAAVASKKSVQANFVKPLPVYIVYMSSAAHVDGRIIDYADIYKRDDKVLAALLDRKPAAEAKVAERRTQ